MGYFVEESSIVRKIWGKSDTILFIFAGASAEFALNKAVDWLYFTGKLPSDPLGRLFSTVNYARGIVFAEEKTAFNTIDRITSIHNAVENARKDRIPDWAYRDVLYMLIHYSIAAFELLERKLNPIEKEEVFNVFFRVGRRMNIPNLPVNFDSWLIDRDIHLKQDLQFSKYSGDLFFQYRKHLGPFRYKLLVEGQKLVVPQRVKQLLGFNKIYLLRPVLAMYKVSRFLKLDWFLKSIVLPGNYRNQIKSLDQ